MTKFKELPRFSDSISFIYVEKSIIEQDARAVAAWRENRKINIPCAAINTILLGPGTTISHAAVRNLANSGCSIVWVGEDNVRFYAYGKGESKSSGNLLQQAKCWGDPLLHLQIVRKMYERRFNIKIPEAYTLQQLRGLEGSRVKNIYQKLSETYNVNWTGRKYNEGETFSTDAINQAISYANSCLYGICHAGIISLGYSPALGFIHTGQQLSFVYDIADLFKMETVIPLAFKTISSLPEGNNIEQKLRSECRQYFHETRILKKITEALHRLFNEEKEPLAVEISYLWDAENGTVEGGTNYSEEEA